MLDSPFIILPVATLLGFLAGLGVGGGSLLILWLTLVLNINSETARIMNLLFFLPTALISSFFRWKQGNLNFRKTLPAILLGCASAAVFSIFARYLSGQLLRKLFGILLLVTGLKELMYTPKN